MSEIPSYGPLARFKILHSVFCTEPNKIYWIQILWLLNYIQAMYITSETWKNGNKERNITFAEG